eukprot:TRINITY_DN3545_c0_g1_i1.p1 TRINITY_DN3545_c0_g1~~TRINITY_DN3545_c0_g1_i1.p1  ORF type:complete len:708 (-),score=102.83 TRINITY_DN3545_c0_g1_i1:39-2129(-)
MEAVETNPNPVVVEDKIEEPVKVDYSQATDGTRVIHDDPWLEPFAQTLRDRYSTFQWWKKDITDKEGSLGQFGLGYETFGFHRVEGGLRYRDWVPGALAVHLYGEFNNWSFDSHPCSRNEYGVWEAFLPDHPDGTPQIPHCTKLKVAITTGHGRIVRISPWTRYVTMDPGNPVMDGVYWNPPYEWTYQWKHERPPKPDRLRIYEAHIGMATEHQKIGSYKEFEVNLLPYIAEMGYNCIQLMAIMEHSYYASFGYQVTNFFAPSSRFGTPEDLKSLIDTAHSLGLYVLLDLVHSHASKNTLDGLNQFDGTDACYFNGTHSMWDSRLFAYDRWEVLRFLLSNLRYWIDTFRFDGFRFDGVTAMLLTNRSVGELPNDYNGYFGSQIDGDALRYLTLANHMLHELYPFIITIAEDATGFACLCRPTEEGGVGFDYRLGMGLPDKWKKLMVLKDEDWNMGSLTYELQNRRYHEKTVGYVESHDQALVGDKTMAFWLMDKEMYTEMSVLSPLTPVIDRGIQLHKMMRLITFALGGEAYLTFMGNEFGHPEWIDFPREGNGGSFHYCCRRWYLAKDPLLRYQHLSAFEKAMLKVEIENPFLNWKDVYVGIKHEGDKVVSFEKAGLLFLFNFHPTKSFADYRVPVGVSGKYVSILDSDAKAFGGHDRLDSQTEFFTEDYGYYGRPYSLLTYLPCRSAFILKKID